MTVLINTITLEHFSYNGRTTTKQWNFGKKLSKIYQNFEFRKKVDDIIKNLLPQPDAFIMFFIYYYYCYYSSMNIIQDIKFHFKYTYRL